MPAVTDFAMAQPVMLGIDRMVRNIETGRFDTSLAALQGTYLHARRIAQNPGGWHNARYNMEMGPQLLAPAPLDLNARPPDAPRAPRRRATLLDRASPRSRSGFVGGWCRPT